MKIGLKSKFLKNFFYVILLINAATVGIFEILRGKKIKTWVPDKG